MELAIISITFHLNALIFFCEAALSVYILHPHSATARFNVVRSLYLVLILMLEFCHKLLRFIINNVAIAKSLFISLKHFPSAVILLPKYLNESNVSRTLPIIRINWARSFLSFSTISILLFSALSSMPYFLYVMSNSEISCQISLFFHIRLMSSMKHRFAIASPYFHTIAKCV